MPLDTLVGCVNAFAAKKKIGGWGGGAYHPFSLSCVFGAFVGVMVLFMLRAINIFFFFLFMYPIQ